MSLQDSYFSDDVENDLIDFSKDETRKRDPKASAMGVQEQCSLSSTQEFSVQKQRVKTVPTVEIYRPPAARRKRNEPVISESTTNQPVADSCASTKTIRQKRPDRAVYVPRHRRSLEVEESPVRQEKSRLDKHKEQDSILTEKILPSSNISTINNEKYPEKGENFPSDFIENQETDLTTTNLKLISNSQNDESSNLSNCTTNSSKTDESSRTESSLILETDDNSNRSASDSKLIKFINDIKTTDENNKKISSSETLTIDRNNMSEIIMFKSNEENCDIEMSPNRQEVDDDASRRDIVVNQKNKRIISNNSKSDVIIITDDRNREEAVKEEVSVTPITPPEKKKVKKIERPKSKPAAPPSPSIKADRDELDWDSLFDDNGDCLDPSLINELTTAVGEVTIEQPKNSYKTYTKTIEVSSDEYAHVLEIYNFPSNFKTCDLVAVFSPFKSGGFELKWVDDTHCLGVFSSPLVAAEVLASDHPVVKTRPLSEATALSKTKARRGSEFLQPYRNRPETCAALARRLVTGALGVKLATARQEREREKIVLREAKEKKKLANKQRDDAWEGVITEK
ncbi:coiled-coil domain-containing protein R3HCC1L isoform X2 [Leptopilina heterotoma]|uniref:coiled-coil domain-containing protein R3HCC1L isoform X2 n=1 Tax=Leptopilina heterotoma TaxID=63436 RepID=UPI001CA95635|nr:coiled-coil domain-containing protein R3HCC1L isoform X2 [Leptopilina heterotoma]